MKRNLLLCHLLKSRLPKGAAVGDGRVVVHPREHGLGVHGGGGDDLSRRHLLHALQRLLFVGLVEIRGRAAIVGNLEGKKTNKNESLSFSMKIMLNRREK